MLKKIIIVSILSIFISQNIKAQEVSNNQWGNWYMYFWDTNFKESNFGLQGDIQYRNWNLIGDLEQLLLRAGVTYKPKKANVKFTLGYGHITSGEFGDGNDTSSESRIYQEALIPHKIAGRFFAKHRFRYEQRFVENQDFRTRYRYNLFLNVPITKKDFSKKSIYLALYNELFINGQRDIGDGKSVEIFDRNRFYSGFGYVINQKLKIQLGHMIQSTNALDKSQWQISLHHSI